MTHHPKSSNRTMYFRLPPRQNQRRTRAPKAPPIASGGPGGQGPPGAAGPPPQGGGPAAKTPVLATAAGQSHIPAQGQSRTSWEKGVAEAQAAIDRDKPAAGGGGQSRGVEREAGVSHSRRQNHIPTPGQARTSGCKSAAGGPGGGVPRRGIAAAGRRLCLAPAVQQFLHPPVQVHAVHLVQVVPGEYRLHGALGDGPAASHQQGVGSVAPGQA